MPYRNIYIPNNNIKQQLQTTGKVRYIGLPPIVGRNNFLDKPAVQTIIRPAQYATFGIDKGVQVLKRLANRYLPTPIARGAKTILDYTLGENVGRGTVQAYELLNENNKKAYGGTSTLTPNIVAGGKAIDLGNNFYYMQGRKHSQGGIDIGPNNKNGLEVEGGEVVQVKPNEIKVFSSVPFLRGNSPAQLVMGGANPNKVFDAQEKYKDKNKLNDDGTKYRNGGDIQYIIDKINNSNKDFAKRLKQNNRKYIKDWEFPNRIATHKLSVGTDENGNNYIYPEVQNINGELYDFTDPKHKHNKYDGQISAEERGDTIHINTIEDGLNFTSNYKDLDIYPKFKIGGRKKAELGAEKQDNTSVTKPLMQEYFPAVGARKVYNDIKEILTRNGQIKPGNIEIVSPEFDLLTGIRGLTNMIIKDIPISKGSYYRVVGKDAIDDAKQVGIIRTPTEPKFDVQTLDRLSKDLKIPFNDIKNKTVEEIRELVRTSNLPPSKKLIRAKSNHGDVGFSKEGFFYKPNKNNYVIEGTENNSTFLQGHHGSYSGRFNKDINAGEPVVLREGENASNFTYWQNYPIIGWRNHKFKYGGGMNYIINGNVKNSLRHIRPKAKLGDWFRIDDTKYKVGNTFDYNGQKYYVNARNEAIPISGDISKANPDAITSAPTAVNWLSNVEKFTPNVTTYKTTTRNTNKSKNNKQTFSSRKYTYNPNLVDIPETNIGNIGAYFYTNKPKSNKSKSSTSKTTSQKSYSTAPVNYDNKITKEMNDLATNIIYNLPIQSTKSTVSDLARVPSQLTMIDKPVGIATPEYYSTNNKEKLLDGITKNDYISLGSNIAGNLISALIGSTTSRKLPYVDLPKISAPLFLSAPKLRTTYNINPQLSEIDEQTQRAIGDINRNTGSSQVALARKQRVRNAAQTEKNKLYGQKENIETELINKDILNRQQVNARNASIYNDYLDRQYQNAIRQVQLNRETDLYNQKIFGNRTAGWINALSGINSGVQDLLSRLEERRSLNETLKAVSARTPDASKIMNLLFGQYLK